MEILKQALIDATTTISNPSSLAATRDEMTARDWATFFEALSKFISVLLPLILPLFTEKETK